MHRPSWRRGHCRPRPSVRSDVPLPYSHSSPSSESRDGMSRRFVEQLRDGESLDDIYLVTDKQLRANRNGNYYIQMELRDRTGGVAARLWNAGEHVFRSFDNGDFLRCEGKVQLFQGGLQVILDRIEREEAHKVDTRDFLPQTEQEIPRLYERLRGHLHRLSNPHLRALAECFLMDPMYSALI
eukprot:Opistho-2@5177